MLLCACAYGVKSEISQVRNVAWHQWFSLQRCCNTFCFVFNQRCAECLCLYTVDFVSAGKNTLLLYVTVYKKVVVAYHGWISTMTSSNEISWKSPPPKWRAGCDPGINWKKITITSLTEVTAVSTTNLRHEKKNFTPNAIKKFNMQARNQPEIFTRQSPRDPLFRDTVTLLESFAPLFS